MQKNGVVGSISLGDRESWEEKWFVTVDVDWAHDDVLGYAIDLVEEAGVYATWLITHKTRWLERLATNPLFELGLHPNFNGLISGDQGGPRSPRAVLEELLAFVPKARVVRSHSIAYSSRLSEIFVELGLTHDLNSYIPRSAAKSLSPWLLPNSQLRIPYIWEDDLEFPIREIPNWGEWQNFQVINFHPIHLFLNTENTARYESTRHIHKTPKELGEFRNRSLGTETIFKSLASFLTA